MFFTFSPTPYFLPILYDDLILPYGRSTSAAGPTSRFDGTSDVRKFLFALENTLARDRPEKERARGFMRYLDGSAFDFYYEIFGHDGRLNVEGLEYDTVKETLFQTVGC